MRLENGKLALESENGSRDQNTFGQHACVGKQEARAKIVSPVTDDVIAGDKVQCVVRTKAD